MSFQQLRASFACFEHLCNEYCELLDDLETPQQIQDFALNVFWPNARLLLDSELTETTIQTTCYQFFLDVNEAGYDWYGTVDDTEDFLLRVWYPLAAQMVSEYPPQLSVDTELAQRTYEEQIEEKEEQTTPHTPYSSPSTGSSQSTTNSQSATEDEDHEYNFETCEIHSIEQKKLYCKDCNEMLCVYCHACTQNDHKNHTTCYYTQAEEQVQALFSKNHKRKSCTPYYVLGYKNKKGKF